MTAAVVIGALSLTVGAFDIDDAALWMYFNNVVSPVPLFWRLGYVHVLPEFGAFALRPLPLVAQAIGYRVFAVVAAAVLFRSIRDLLGVYRYSRVDASVMSLGIVIGLAGLDPALVTELSWVPWTAWLAGVAYLLASVAEARRPSLIAVAGCGLAFCGTPLGVLVAPLAGWIAWTSPRGRARYACICACALAGGAGVLLQSGEWQRPAPVLVDWLVAQWSGDWQRSLVIVIAATIGLTAITIATRLAATVWLLYFSVASTLAYWFSPRIADSGYEARYVTIPCAALMLAVAIVSRERRPQWRRVPVAYLAAGLLLFAQEAYAGGRGPLVLTWYRYQFLHHVAQFRRECREPEMMVFEDEPSSTVALCRPRVFAPGFYPVLDFVPMMGSYSDATPLVSRPAVPVYQPIQRGFASLELMPPIHGR